ncbi:hypothetical protein FI667_g1964, partial [Globisporangium splendens]
MRANALRVALNNHRRRPLRRPPRMRASTTSTDRAVAVATAERRDVDKAAATEWQVALAKALEVCHVLGADLATNQSMRFTYYPEADANRKLPTFTCIHDCVAPRGSVSKVEWTWRPKPHTTNNTSEWPEEDGSCVHTKRWNCAYDRDPKCGFDALEEQEPPEARVVLLSDARAQHKAVVVKLCHASAAHVAVASGIVRCAADGTSSLPAAHALGAAHRGCQPPMSLHPAADVRAALAASIDPPSRLPTSGTTRALHYVQHVCIGTFGEEARVAVLEQQERARRQRHDDHERSQRRRVPLRH